MKEHRSEGAKGKERKIERKEEGKKKREEKKKTLSAISPFPTNSLAHSFHCINWFLWQVRFAIVVAIGSMAFSIAIVIAIAISVVAFGLYNLKVFNFLHLFSIYAFLHTFLFCISAKSKFIFTS